MIIAAFCASGMDVILMVMVAVSGVGENFARSFVTAIAGLFFGAAIAFGRRKTVSGGLILFGVTALLAGFLQMLPVKNVGLFCMVGTLLLPMLIGGITRLFRTKQIHRFLYEAKLYQGTEEKCLRAFMDTGNRLRLPGSMMPVVLVDRTYLTEWINRAETTMPQKLVFLPYKGVGGKGLLHGVRLQCVLNLGNGQSFFGEVAAVAAEHNLFQGCEYQMILQPEILAMACVTDTQEGEKNAV